MKTIFILFLTLTLLQGDELKRIESIINDIAKLRVEHEECKRALDSKGTIKVETTKVSDCKNHEKTIEILNAKNTLLDKKLQEQTKILKNTQNEREVYKKEAKAKDDMIKTLTNQISILEKKSTSEPKVVVKEVIKEVVKEKKIYPKNDNVFPTLMPKEAKVVNKNIKEKEIKQETKPTTYRLKNDSKIYSSLDEDEISVWERDRSFTSNMKTQNFIMITGFFINKEWQSAEEELWIKQVDVFER